MKKIIISLICVCFISMSGISQEKKTEILTKSQINFLDSNKLKQGFWEENDRQYNYSGNFVDGLKEGVWVKHQKNKLFQELQTYHKGKKNGIHIKIDRRGYFILEENFKNDSLDGFSKHYSRGSIPKSIISYKNGKIDGKKIIYYENKANKIMEETYYKNGLKNGSSRWFDEDGRVMAKYNYNNNAFEGEQITYHPNNSVMTKQSFKNNLPIGTYYEYFDNGKIKIFGSYTDGLKHGKWKEFNEESKILKVIRYKKGIARKF